MKKMLLCVIFIGVFMILNGCGQNKLAYYNDTYPKADIKEYFTGPIKAWGLVQDWRGRVVNRFDINMVGSWEGDHGILKEDFHYYNGKTQQRTWKIIKNADGSYAGTASDIFGQAQGHIAGSAVRWAYEMNVPVDDKTYRLSFDDWMWQMHDGVLINRSYLKKFGFTVAELTIFMKKQ